MAHEAGEGPAVRGHRGVVAAVIRQSRSADDPAREGSPEVASAPEVTGGRDRRDRGSEQERDQSAEADLLDRRGPRLAADAPPDG